MRDSVVVARYLWVKVQIRTQRTCVRCIETMFALSCGAGLDHVLKVGIARGFVVLPIGLVLLVDRWRQTLSLKHALLVLKELT